MLHTDPSQRRYSYSALAAWLTCQRKFYWNYQRNLVLDVPAAAPHFGAAIHTGLHTWFEGHDLEATLERLRAAMAGAPADLLRTVEKGELILRGYVRQWPQEPFTILANEVEFALPMSNGSTLIGRVDRVIQWGDRILVKETKTTSGGIGAAFFKQFAPNLQIDIECYAVAKQWGHCEGALIDAIQVCKTKEGYARDVTDRTADDLVRFEARYARIIHDMEEVIHAEPPSRDHFLQNQLSCTYYGECPYRPLCLYNNDGLIEGRYRARDTEETHGSDQPGNA